MHKKIIACLVFCLVLSNCSTSVDFYKTNKPRLNILNFFCGKTEGYGIFFDYTDKATVRFKITATGDCGRAGALKLKQNIVFEDGSTENDSFEASMVDIDDVILIGNTIEEQGKAEQAGNAANLKYTRIIKKGLHKTTMDVSDWMYMVDKNQVISRANLKKFYLFNVGEIIIIWRKV